MVKFKVRYGHWPVGQCIKIARLFGLGESLNAMFSLSMASWRRLAALA